MPWYSEIDFVFFFFLHRAKWNGTQITNNARVLVWYFMSKWNLNIYLPSSSNVLDELSGIGFSVIDEEGFSSGDKPNFSAGVLAIILASSRWRWTKTESTLTECLLNNFQKQERLFSLIGQLISDVRNMRMLYCYVRPIICVVRKNNSPSLNVLNYNVEILLPIGVRNIYYSEISEISMYWFSGRKSFCVYFVCF